MVVLVVIALAGFDRRIVGIQRTLVGWFDHVGDQRRLALRPYPLPLPLDGRDAERPEDVVVFSDPFVPSEAGPGVIRSSSSLPWLGAQPQQ
jgi:hypothetical protein